MRVNENFNRKILRKIPNETFSKRIILKKKKSGIRNRSCKSASTCQWFRSISMHSFVIVWLCLVMPQHFCSHRFDDFNADDIQLTKADWYTVLHKLHPIKYIKHFHHMQSFGALSAVDFLIQLCVCLPPYFSSHPIPFCHPPYTRRRSFQRVHCAWFDTWSSITYAQTS